MNETQPHVMLPLVLMIGSSLGTSHAADEPAWQPLFNGRTLEGWTVKCKPTDRTNQFWRVEDGSLLADSMNGPKHDYVWLLTDQEYANFVLRLKFQAYRDNPGNSGIQIRSRYDDEAGWLDGPQIDINPPGPWRTGMIWDETRGVQRWLWPDVPKGQWVNEKMARPDLMFRYSDQGDGWNDLQISARGMKISATLNGLTIMDYNGGGVLDDVVHKQRKVGERGHIGLQIHTGDRLRIRFKDIQIQDWSR